MPVLESPIRKMNTSKNSGSLEHLKDNDNVFVCEITGKAFTEYSDFAYNFMNLRMEHWRCEFTKRGSLTYVQALESKKKVNDQAKKLPKPIRKAIFYLIHKSRHASVELLAHDIFYYVKDRYFKGETVNVYMKNNKNYAPALITDVVNLSDESTAEIELSPKVCLYKVLVTPKKQTNNVQAGPMTVGFEMVKRSPRVYTEAVTRCLVYTSTKMGSDGFITLKENLLPEIHNLRFADLFINNISTPQLKGQKNAVRLMKVVNGMSNGLSLNKSQTMSGSPIKANGSPRKPEVVDPNVMKERFKNFLKGWHSHKDDLELEDHKMLPNFPKLSFSGIPDECIGDLLGILSFFDDFSHSKELEEWFDITIDMEKLANSLTKRDSINDYYEIACKLCSFLLKENEVKTTPKKGGKNVGENGDDIQKWMDQYLCLYEEEDEIKEIAMSEILRLRLDKFSEQNAENKETSFVSEAFMNYVKKISQKLATMHVSELSVSDRVTLLKLLMEEMTSSDSIKHSAENSREETRQFSYNMVKLRASKKNYGLTMHKVKKGKVTDLPKESTEELYAKYKECEEKLHEMSSKYPSPWCFGMDRAFRRYFLFKSIPALCVETNPTHIGGCLDKMVLPDPVLAKCSNSEKLKELKKRCFYQKARPINSLNMVQESTDVLLNRLNMCSATNYKCPVHNAPESWRYISTPEMFSDLMTSLNDRGVRESGLKHSFRQSKAFIEDCLSKCPLSRLPSPSDDILTPPEDSMEQKLRSRIHTFEDKLIYNELSKPDVKNRQSWLERVVLNGEKDTENPKLLWGPELQYNEITDSKFEDIDHRFMSDSQWENYKEKITNLRSVMLRLAQGIDRQNLTNPLVVLTRLGYRRVKHYENLENWEHSLMTQTTSLAQVALHLKALEDSIMWIKSVHRKCCHYCKKPLSLNLTKIATCTKCSIFLHPYCMKPRRKSVPTTPWLCNTCRLLKSSDDLSDSEASKTERSPSSEIPNKVPKLTNGFKSKVESDRTMRARKPVSPPGKPSFSAL